MKRDNIDATAIVAAGCTAIVIYAVLIVGFIAAVAYAVKWVIS